MSATDVQALVDALAAELGRPVGVDDRRFHALAYSSHAGDIDPVRRDSILRRQAPVAVTTWLESLRIPAAKHPVRVPANADLGMAARVCLPLRFDEILLGFLWLIDEPEPLDEAALELASRYADEVGAELYNVGRLETDRRAREATLVGRLLLTAEDPPRAARRLLDEALVAATSYAVLVVDVHEAVRQPTLAIAVRLAAALEQVRRSVAPHHLVHMVSGKRATGILAFESPDEVSRRAHALHAAVAEQFAKCAHGIVVGVGATRADVVELRGSHAEAEDAVRVARGVADIGPVASWNELGAYRPIAALLGDRDPAPLMPPALKRLFVEHDAATLVATLEAYLEHAGDVQAAAAALFVHRSSLYNRIHRIEEVARVDLRSGDDRLELQLGLRLWRLSGATGVEPAQSTARHASPPRRTAPA